MEEELQVVSEKSRKTDMNTDVVPRCHLTLRDAAIKGSEFSNPNIWLKQIIEDETEIRKVLTKIRAFPVKVNFDASIIVKSEIDTFKAIESIENAIMFYRHMYFEFNFMYIDAVSTFPENKKIEINRQFSMDDTELIKVDFSFEVDTYYPAFNEEQIWGRPKKSRWINQLKEATTDRINLENRKE